ncbi:hypothetical protein ACOMHN_059550 [Nucella lapillus]
MAEARRVEFQTVSEPKEEKKSTRPTLIPRFNLALGESTSTTCPEFSFTELLKKEKVDGEPTVNDAFGDEDDCHDEVAALARKFEEKYGPRSEGKKRKLKCVEDDYYDLGDGYDENDTFIDNTEAYDEVIPSCLTTIHGGFYINRGTLDFKTLSDQDDSEAEFTTPVVRKRGRPRKIVDSEDSRDDGEEMKKRKLMKKKKAKEGVEGEKKKKRKLSYGPDGEKILKRKKLINPDRKKKTSPSVQELLKHQTATTASPSAVNGSAESYAPSPPQLSPPADRSGVTDSIEGAAATLQEGEEKKMGEGEVQLPSDLPAELAAAIVDIKKAAKDSKEGKCKFFSPHVNKLLLDIELASRQLASGKRPLIYCHLADHLPCGKETLIKRAKKLRENQQDDQLKAPILRLKQEIDQVMPQLQEQHDRDVAKARLENRDRREGGEGPREEGGVNTESDDDDKNTASNTAPEGQSRRGNRDPRKKFRWTPEIRSVLCEIVAIKMRMFDTYKFRNQTAEEYLKTFLDNEIRILWPQGWIQTRMLFKETRSVHGSWTNTNVKVKRQVPMSRSTASPTPASSVQSTMAGVPDSATSPPANTNNTPSTTNTASAANAAASGDPEVIEVSDIDEPTPATSREKGKVATGQCDDSLRSAGGDSLKFSPNSMEAVAMATAAAVAAAVSSAKSDAPSLGERRPHLMSEMLKRPGSTGESSAPGPRTAVVPPPKTPPAGDPSVSPFMAEFNRYLSSSNSQPPSSPPPRQGPSPTQAPRQGPSPAPSPRQGPSPAPSPRQGPSPAPHPRQGPSPASHPRQSPSPAPNPRQGPSPAPSPRQGPSPALSPRQGPSAASTPRQGPSPQQSSRTTPPSTGRPEDIRGNHPSGWKVEEGVGCEWPRKMDVPPSPGGPKMGEASSYAHYKLPSSVVKGEGRTQGNVVCHQILAKIQAEIDAHKAARIPDPRPSPGNHSNPQRTPPPAHSSHGVTFAPRDQGLGAASVSRPPSLPLARQAPVTNASLLRQQAPAPLPPYTSRQSVGGAGSRPSGVNSGTSSLKPSVSRLPGINTASVSRPQTVNTASVSRPSPVARQSPKAVTRPSPGHVTAALATLAHQSPQTVTRPLAGGVTRVSPGSVTRVSPGSMTRVSPGSVTRATTPGDPAAMTGSGVTRSMAGSPAGQLLTSAHLPPQRNPPTSAPLPSVSLRPLSLSTHKKPSHNALSFSSAVAPSAVRPQQPSVTRVTTGQGQVMPRAAGGQSLLQKSSPPTPHRGSLPSHAPGTAHRGVPLGQGQHSVPRAPPGGILSRGQLVGASQSQPRMTSQPGTPNMLNRVGPLQKAQGDKAASSLTPGVPSGSQAGGGSSSAAHSRPSPNTTGLPTIPRPHQPAAAAVTKGVSSPPAVSHPGTMPRLPPHPLTLDPRAVYPSKPSPGFSQ